MDISRKMMTATAVLTQPRRPTPPEEYLRRGREWTTILEDHEAERQQRNVAEVRPDVARELGVAPGTLENLRNGRLKTLAVHIYDRLQRAMLRRLEAQLRRTEHEIQILKTQGVDPREDEMAAALADRMALREALGLGADQ